MLRVLHSVVIDQDKQLRSYNGAICVAIKVHQNRRSRYQFYVLLSIRFSVVIYSARCIILAPNSIHTTSYLYVIWLQWPLRRQILINTPDPFIFVSCLQVAKYL